MARTFVAVALLLICSNARADLVLPAKLTSHASDALVRAGFLDATIYGADPSGKADSTAAIQAAINDARDYYLTTYLPAGTYRVSDTLLGLQYDDAFTNAGTFAPYGVPQAPSLVGPPSGPRAVLQLVDHSNGFADPTNPKPLVRFVNNGYYLNGTLGQEYQDAGPSYDQKAMASDILMYAVIRDVDFTLGDNAGATGVWFYAAQYSYLENLTIDATSAYAGIQGFADTEVWTNLSVKGGQYGVMFDDRGGGATIAGLTLSGQSKGGFYNDHGGAAVLVGFDIREDSAPGVVLVNPYGAQSTTLSLIDGHIAATGAPAITNANGVDLYIENVYVEASAIVQGAVASSGALDLVTRYSHTETATSPAATAGNVQTSYNVIDGKQGQADIVAIGPKVSTFPSDLVSRHLPGALPWLTDANVADVTQYGADPTGNTDSTAAIQAAVQANTEVFFPRGDYAITSTITLNPDTKLFGVPGPRSRIMAPYWDPKGQLQPFIRTADDAAGKTFVGDLGLIIDFYVTGASVPESMTYLSAIEWNTGRSSVLHQVAVEMQWSGGTDFTTAPRKLMHVQKHGGGRWFGYQNVQIDPGQQRSNNPQFRTLMVDGTSAPLTLYGSNPEHTETFMYQLQGASNVRLLGLKSEVHALVDIHASSNVELAGLCGDTYNLVEFDATSDLAIANISYYSENNEASVAYITDDSGKTWPFSDGYSLFTVGTFDASPFPHCGDSVCDGAETSSNCPSDCDGTSGTTGTSAAGSALAVPTSDAGIVPTASSTTATKGHGCDYAGGTSSPVGIIVAMLLYFATARSRRATEALRRLCRDAPRRTMPR